MVWYLFFFSNLFTVWYFFLKNFIYCLVFKILKFTKQSQKFGIFSLRIWYLVLKITWHHWVLVLVLVVLVLETLYKSLKFVLIIMGT